MKSTEMPLPAYIDPEAWDGFVEMRRAMPKTRPFTMRAAKLILVQLQRIKDAGHDPNAALDQSTVRGWAGVWPAVDNSVRKAEKVETTAEYVARMKREEEEERKRVCPPPANVREFIRRAIGR